MKKLFNLGDGVVTTSSPMKTAFEMLFTIYDEFQQLLEPSAYVGQDEDRRSIREMFHISGKSDAFALLCENKKALCIPSESRDGEATRFKSSVLFKAF